MIALVFETYFYVFAVVLSIGGDIEIIITYNDIKKYIHWQNGPQPKFTALKSQIGLWHTNNCIFWCPHTLLSAKTLLERHAVLELFQGSCAATGTGTYTEVAETKETMSGKNQEISISQFETCKVSFRREDHSCFTLGTIHNSNFDRVRVLQIHTPINLGFFIIWDFRLSLALL